MQDSSAMKSADKIMKMLLYICRQEDKIDQNAYDAIYEAYKLAAEKSTSKPEVEDNFKKNLGRKYGPKSKTYYDMVQSVKSRLASKDPKILQMISQSMVAAPTSQHMNPANNRMGDPPPSTTMPTFVQQAIPQQQQNVYQFPAVESKPQNLMHVPVPMGVSISNALPPSTQQQQISIPFVSNPSTMLPSAGIQSIHSSLHPLLQNTMNTMHVSKPPNPVSNVPYEPKLTGIKPELGLNKSNANMPEQNQDLDLIMNGNLATLQSEEGIVVSETSAEGPTVDPVTVSQERISSRQLMRESVSSRLGTSNKIDDELWKTQNVITQEMLLKMLGKFNNVKMSSSTQKFLLEAIQQHLKTILESAVEISRKRLNRSASSTFSELRNMIIEGDGNIDGNQSTVALKWGPPINDVIRKEDAESRALLRKYIELDDKYSKEKMKLYDEDRAKASALKKRPGDAIDELWWDADKAKERNALLTLEGLSEIYYKQDLAQSASLGPNAKKVARPKSEDNNPLPVPSTAGYVTDLRDFQYPIKQSAADWKNQPCPINILPSQMLLSPMLPELKVTVEDVLYMINKSTARKGALVGVRFTQDVTLAGVVTSKWKLIGSKPC